jgi:hypothetical protein
MIHAYCCQPKLSEEEHLGLIHPVAGSKLVLVDTPETISITLRKDKLHSLGEPEGDLLLGVLDRVGSVTCHDQLRASYRLKYSQTF